MQNKAKEKRQWREARLTVYALPATLLISSYIECMHWSFEDPMSGGGPPQLNAGEVINRARLSSLP